MRNSNPGQSAKHNPLPDKQERILRLLVFLPFIAVLLLALVLRPEFNRKSKAKLVPRETLAVASVSLANPLDVLVDAALKTRLPTGCKRIGRGPIRGEPDMKERKVAITFDDGPSPTTEKLLSTLAKYQVHATFFVVGRNVSKYQSSLGEMIMQGHMIGNHTYSHSPVYKKKQLTDDIGLDTKLIKQASGFTPCLFRPPYGLIKGPLKKVTYKHGMTIIMWNVDAADYTRPGSEAIASRTISAVQPGSIILLHDLPQSVAAVPKIVKELKKRHYEFVTVNELLGSRLTYDAQ